MTTESVPNLVRKAIYGTTKKDDEYFIGEMFETAESCGAVGEDAVFVWMQSLGNSLDMAGFTMMSGKGRPDLLYARRDV